MDLRASPRLPLGMLLACMALHGCGPADAGAAAPQGGPPPAGFATDIVAAQNAVRASPVSVGGSPTPSPALAPLAWSTSAAAVAQAWADGCTYQHNAGRGDLGENIAATSPSGAYTATGVVGLWASEAPFYDWATNTCDAANPANDGHTCGHYTQLVWRDTTVVGCGFRSCSTGSPFGSGSWDFWVCDYGPPGNWVGQKPY